MASRTEFSLEELLADPIVKLLMCRDGVSLSDARALYAAVAPRLKGRAPRPSELGPPIPLPWIGASRDPLSRCL
jgi:hypothetical protein